MLKKEIPLVVNLRIILLFILATSRYGHTAGRRTHFSTKAAIATSYLGRYLSSVDRFVFL